MTQTTKQTTRVLLAATAAALAILVAGVGNATAAPAASQEATSNCWLQVINDWLAHQPNLTGTYAIPCYTQAIQHLNLYPDVQGYSSATDDIRNAMYAVIHEEGRGGGPPSSGPGASSSSGPPTSSSTSGGSKGGHRGLFARIGDRLAPGNAQSVPLPLLVLGGLALLLLLAAFATWFARRVQARRMTPAPSPAPRP